MVVHQCQQRAVGGPADVLAGERLLVAGLAAVELPAAGEAARAEVGRDLGVAEAVHAKKQDLVIAQQGVDAAADVSGLRGEAHDEVNGAEAVGAAVDEITEEPQRGAAARPRAVRIDQTGVGERRDQLRSVPVHIADHVRRLHFRHA